MIIKTMAVVLLASLITSECSICSEQEQYLVGSTVLNRVDSPDYPNTILGVISQPRQYHGYESEWFIPTEKTLKVAKDLLEGHGRDCEVVYFYARDGPNKGFIQAMKDKEKYTLEHHNYATK